jgi:hypothetical protein
MNSVLENRIFKPVKGGYIFQLQKGIFHHPQAYRVTKAQKAQILSVIEPERGRWMPWVARSALALAVASGTAVDQAAGASLFHSVVASEWAFLIAQIIGTSILYRAVWRRLQPLVAGLPHSHE